MLEPGNFYHIYNHANGFENIFVEDENYSFFLRKLIEHIMPVADILGFCFMPNHFHLAIKIKHEEEIIKLIPSEETGETISYDSIQRLVSKRFANLFSSYTQSFNKVYHRKGSLFRKNFKSKAIENQVQLLNTILYIHLNPVKHGFTRNHTDWPWTSYNYFFKMENAKFLNTSVIENLIENESIYRKLHIDRQQEILKMMEE